MTHRRFRRGCVAGGSLVALTPLPTEGHGQVACRAGPLGVERQSSAATWATASPPQRTLLTRLLSLLTSALTSPLGLSFWADGAPLDSNKGLSPLRLVRQGTLMERAPRDARALRVRRRTKTTRKAS